MSCLYEIKHIVMQTKRKGYQSGLIIIINNSRIGQLTRLKIFMLLAIFAVIVSIITTCKYKFTYP